MNDDLNAPRALALAWELMRGDAGPAVKRATFARFDEVFGLGLASWLPPADEIPAAIAALAHSRAAARRAKDWTEADRLRNELQAAGYEMEDRADGYTVRRR